MSNVLNFFLNWISPNSPSYQKLKYDSLFSGEETGEQSSQLTHVVNIWAEILVLMEEKSESAQLCLTLCEPMDCSPPGSSFHGISQAGILEWVAMSFSRGSSQPRDQTQVSLIAGRFFIIWAIREAWWKRREPQISKILQDLCIDLLEKKKKHIYILGVSFGLLMPSHCQLPPENMSSRLWLLLP